MKKFLKISTSLAVASSLLLAQAAFAEHGSNSGSTATGGKTQTEAQKNFCTSLTAQTQKFLKELNSQSHKLQGKVDGERQDANSNRHDSDSRMDQQKSKADGERHDIFKKLDDKAQTEAQKLAVANFESAIQDAATARDSAIKTATDTFRQSMDQLIALHKTSVKQTLVTYLAAVQGAVKQAQTECAAGTDPVTVKAKFKDALENAKAARQENAQQLDKIGPQVEALAQARNEAVKNALENYKTAVQAAIGALKAAFGTTAK